MRSEDAIESLRELGFNQLEAEVYLYLLPSPPVTAYRIGQALGRPTANVYKAVESLARRGAVLVEDGDQRVCQAVPVAELKKQLEKGFQRSLEVMERSLAKLESAPPDERVYKIESAVRLFEQCSQMLDRAQTVVVVDAFPHALERIRPRLLEVLKRGVALYVEAYEPIDLPGARVILVPMGRKSIATWQSEQLNLVVDGREHLLALLTTDLESVRQAVWSNSIYLSCIHHAGRLCEHTLVAMIAASSQGNSKEALRLLTQHRFFFNSQVPGQQELLRRFNSAPAEESGFGTRHRGRQKAKENK